MQPPRLRIHPTQEWHDLYQPEANDDLQRFLDRYLLGKNNGWEFTPKVRLSLLRFNGPPISFRAEDSFPPSRTQYKTLFLDAAIKSLEPESPAQDSSISYQSDSWDDDGVQFTWVFSQYTEICGFSKAKLFMSCNDLDDLDVYVIIRKLDRDGKPLHHFNIPLRDMLPGTRPQDVPDDNVRKYVGPNGRLRASMRLIAEDPAVTSEMRACQDPTEVWYPCTKVQKVPRGEIVELDIGIWPGGMVFDQGESLSFEVKGHDPILPEYPALYRKFENQNTGRHWIHTGGRYPSCLTLPFLAGASQWS